MTGLRLAESDADLEAWRRVRLALLPNELCPSAAELHARAAEGWLYLLAELRGEIAGSGLLGRSDLGGAFAAPRVLREHRRRGVGTALLRELAALAGSRGHDELGGHVEEPEALAFAERFGFREVNRQVEQVLAVPSDAVEPVPPRGIELVPLAGRPDLEGRLYGELVEDALRDFAVDREIMIDEGIWRTQWLPSADRSLAALEGGAIVGMAGYTPDEDDPRRAENALTAVRRDRRGRGIARALKLASIALAAREGVEELYTWTQSGNEAMRTLNRSLGYVDRGVVITVRGPLPLPAPPVC